MGSLLRNHDVRFVTLEHWPGNRTAVPIPSQFKASYSKTCELLDRELYNLRAEHVVIQADCDHSQIRQDGMLRADARMRGPGIILTFESKFGPLSYPCDRFHKWQDNLRAIALSLESLRADQMAYADPAVGRRKGYYERAQDLREAALAKLDGE